MEYEDPIFNLRDAMIIYYVDEYRNALANTNAADVDKDHDVRANEVFLRSEWFDLLSPIDGEDIIQRFRREFNYPYVKD